MCFIFKIRFINTPSIVNDGSSNDKLFKELGIEFEYPKTLSIAKYLLKNVIPDAECILDFFAGSGTVGRVCINEGRNCLMCDSDNKSLEYFAKHISLMEELGQNTQYRKVENIQDFFEYNTKGDTANEKGTI